MISCASATVVSVRSAGNTGACCAASTIVLCSIWATWTTVEGSCLQMRVPWALVVAPHGDVMPCQAASSIPEIEFANVRDRDLDWIWFESPAFNRFRGTDWMSEPCRSCDRAQIDFGGCRCQALLLTNNAAATDPVCHLSPHHDLVVTAREEALEQSLPLVHRSSVASLGVKEAYHK